MWDDLILFAISATIGIVYLLSALMSGRQTHGQLIPKVAPPISNSSRHQSQVSRALAASHLESKLDYVPETAQC
jgi:hypothetical protein